MTRVLVLTLIIVAEPGFAVHSGKDLFLPVAGRTRGPGGIDYYTALWITNVSAEPAELRLEFLRTGETNPSPTPFAEVTRLGPGETRMYDNVTESVLRVSGLGALRIQSSVDVMATARLYSRLGEAGMAATQAVSYGAIPASLAIGQGESTFLQGITQGGDFRYNISIVETTGHPVSLRLELRDGGGKRLGGREVVLQGHEQRTFGSTGLFPSAMTDNAVLLVRGLSGAGRVLLVGSQIAAQSNDGSAFEMQFRQRERSQLAPTELALVIVVVLLLIGGAAMAFRRAGRAG